MSRGVRVLRLSMVTAVLAGLAACGSGGPSSGGEQAAMVKIGLVTSTSGAQAAYNVPSNSAIDMWVKKVESGGIAGHPVDVIVKDDGGDPVKSAQAVRSLVAEKVSVIMDVTNQDAAWVKVPNDAGIPVVGLTQIETFYKDPNWYSVGQTLDGSLPAVVKAAQLAGGTRFAQIYCAEYAQCQQSLDAQKKIAEDAGLPVVYSSTLSASDPNYTAQCVAARDAGADVFFVGHLGTILVRVAEDCARQNFHPKFIQLGTGYTLATKEAQVLKGALYGTFQIQPAFSDSPAVAQFNATLDREYPGVRTDVAKYNQTGITAWVIGVGIERAVELSGAMKDDAITPDVIARGLNAFKDETLGGLTPPLTFTQGKPHSVPCFFLGRIDENGAGVVTNNGQAVCP